VTTDILHCASTLASVVSGDQPTFDDAKRIAEPEYAALLAAIRSSNPRFAFDRDGRPGAIDAVREALPAMEREVFEAVIEDHACELAAVEEALYQFALALTRVRT
jgi:hypothetical protein